MTRKDHPQGTDNVLADLGFEDAEELSAKAVLAVKLNELIDKRSLSQTEAAHITGMTQPKVSQVRRYKLQNISLERRCRHWCRSTSKYRSWSGRRGVRAAGMLWRHDPCSSHECMDDRRMLTGSQQPW